MTIKLDRTWHTPRSYIILKQCSIYSMAEYIQYLANVRQLTSELAAFSKEKRAEASDDAWWKEAESRLDTILELVPPSPEKSWWSGLELWTPLPEAKWKAWTTREKWKFLVETVEKFDETFGEWDTDEEDEKDWEEEQAADWSSVVQELCPAWADDVRDSCIDVIIKGWRELCQEQHKELRPLVSKLDGDLLFYLTCEAEEKVQTLEEELAGEDDDDEEEEDEDE